MVRIGAATHEPGVWRCIRSGGKVNEWLRRDETGIMAIAGGADMATASGFYTGEMYSIMVP